MRQSAEHLNLLLQGLLIPAQRHQMGEHLSPHADPPIASTFHLLLEQFEVRIVAAFGEKLLAVAHFEPPLHAEAFSIGVGFQYQQGRVRRDDVEFFRKRNDFIANRRALSLWPANDPDVPGPTAAE